MCGRTACTLAPDVICNACTYYDGNTQGFRKPTWREHPPPTNPDSGKSYTYYPSANHTPTMFCPVMIKGDAEGDGGRVIQPMMWGIIPPWHKGEAKAHGLSTNNARLEGLAESKLYKRLLTQRKLCVILAQGFYEWKTVGIQSKGPKKPFFIFMHQGNESLKIHEPEAWLKSENENDEKGWQGPRILMMAGLYDTWKSPDEDVVYSYTVITMESNSTLSWLHDRMPAILDTSQQVEAWISASAETPTNELLSILKPVEKLQYYEVSTKVNNSRCRDLDCMNPLPETRKNSFMDNWLKKPGSSSTKSSTKTERSEDDVSTEKCDDEEQSSKKTKFEKCGEDNG